MAKPMWNLSIYITTLSTEKSVEVNGETHVGTLMLNLVEGLGKCVCCVFVGQARPSNTLRALPRCRSQLEMTWCHRTKTTGMETTAWLLSKVKNQTIYHRVRRCIRSCIGIGQTISLYAFVWYARWAVESIPRLTARFRFISGRRSICVMKFCLLCRHNGWLVWSRLMVAARKEMAVEATRWTRHSRHTRRCKATVHPDTQKAQDPEARFGIYRRCYWLL